MFVGGFLSKDKNVEPLEKRDVSLVFENYSNLNIKTKVSKLTLKTGEEFEVITNNEDIKITEGKDTISIDDNAPHLYYHYKDFEVVVIIPNNSILDTVRIEAGAGRVLIEELNCKNAKIDLGAGEVEINKINVADSIKLSGGVGGLNIHDGQLNNLDADLGVGKFTANLYLTGKNDIDAGVGEVDLRLLGKTQDYSFEIEKGMGEIKLNNEKIKSGVYGNGKYSIDISGGIGEIKITTED